jgi:hypothetical protein
VGRASLLAVIIAGLTLASACGDDDDTPDEPTAPPVTVTRSVPPTTGPSSPTAEIEVTGIVGVVNLSGNTIEIRATQGSPITEIAVSAQTRIETVSGRSIRINNIRPSDRISAVGRPSDDSDTLVATRITVQEVVPGSGPGPGG